MSAAPHIRASDPGASVFVTANAGSGKTTTLVSRVARLLRQGADPAAILCVTYTKAAAAEMQRRLYDLLGDWSVLEDAALERELRKLEGQPEAQFDALDLSRARALFARALETPGGLKIQTIHAFCEKLLRRFPLEAEVSPSFQVLEDVAAQELARRARDELTLAAERYGEDDPDQPLARAFNHFAVELSARGFDDLFQAIEGQRDALTGYVKACAEGRAATPWTLCGVNDGADPEAIAQAAVDATDWNAWRAAAAELDGGSSSDHNMAALLRAAEDAQTFDAVCGGFFTKAGEPKKRLATVKIAAGVTAWLTREQGRLVVACAEARAATIARDTGHVLTLAQVYAAIYAQEKRAHRGLDFDDLITKTCDLLATKSDAAWVLYKLDGGIDHVLVDEAQDTAPEQWEIIRKLTGEFFAGAGVRGEAAAQRTLFVVGDEKQSIYGFQGARPELLARETDHYRDTARASGARAEIVPLEASWRSTPQVLSFVDAVFAPADAARALDPANGHAVHHQPMREGDPGSVDIWPVFKDVKPPERSAWDPVDADAGENARKRLAARIAADIAGAVARGDAVQDRELAGPPAERWRAANFGDFLILVRRRDALFEEILRALKQSGVPVAGADRLKLSEHIAFQDLRGVARFALFPEDDLTTAELLRSPFCEVDEGSLFDLAYERDGSLYRALSLRAAERPEWSDALAFLDSARADARGRAPFEMFNRLLGRLDREGRSMRSRLLTRLGREAEEAIDEFLNQILAAEARGVRDLEGLAATLDVSDVTVKRELEAARGEVRVMTVHGAKGLEAPVVYLPDTTVKAKAQGAPLFETGDGGFLWAPRKDEDCAASAAARALRQQKTDEESLRLLYVGLTRARDRLVLCGRTPATRDADDGSWWTRLNDAFASDIIAEHTREIMTEDGVTVRRFGPDPERRPLRAPTTSEQPKAPEWMSQRLTSERGAQWKSPSSIADAAKAPAPSPLSDRGGLGRFRRGDLIHKLFEVLPDIAPDKRRDAAARLLAREPNLTDDQRAEMIDAAFGVLEDTRFAAVFGPGSRAEAAIAGTAKDLPDGVAISGRLDRLIVAPDQVLVVDYKTNRPAPARIEDADPAYVAQMAVYVAVLRALYPGRQVEAALVWTDGPALMPVPSNVIDGALDRLRDAR